MKNYILLAGLVLAQYPMPPTTYHTPQGQVYVMPGNVVIEPHQWQLPDPTPPPALIQPYEPPTYNYEEPVPPTVVRPWGGSGYENNE